jgi:hypothetical protein
MEVLMKCGHTAQGIERLTQKPICIICMCNQPAEQKPDLTGRKARCICYKCKSEVDSSFQLPFFEYRSSNKYDSYYCGCCGWD